MTAHAGPAESPVSGTVTDVELAQPNSPVARIARALRGAGIEAPIALAILAGSIAAPILIRLSAADANSDIPAHAAMAANMVESGEWFTYTLWYPLIYIASAGSRDPALLREVSVLFLLVMVVIRAVLVYYVSWTATRQRSASAAIAMLMVVAMPLLNPWRSHQIYLGQVSPNVWHNSTQIFATPFALLAFVAAVALLRSPTARRAILFSGLILLSTLAKPNYSLALLPVLGIMLIWALVPLAIPLARKVAIVALAFVPVMLLLCSQYLVVFGQEGARKTTLTFAPLVVWGAFSPNILLSLGLSVAGPLAVLFAVPRRLQLDKAMILSWLVLMVSILQLSLFAERSDDGTINLDGNFFWGSYSSIFMLFVVSAVMLCRAYPEKASSLRRGALLAALVILTLHAATGLYYIGRAGVDGFPVH
jgi:hypothetical protein